MAQNHTTPAGLTVEPVMTNTSNQLAPNVFDTPRTLSPAVSIDGPLNAQAHGKPSLVVDVNADLEKGTLSPINSARHVTPSPLYSPCRDFKINSQVQECSIWPSKNTLKAKAQQEKSDRRAGNCYGLSRKWGDMSKKQRLWIKIFLAFCLLALVAGLGVGITRAVGGGVWSGNNKSNTIPKENH